MKSLQRFDQGQRARLAVDDRQHDHAEGLLQLGVLVEIVEHHLRLFAALELDHDAHAVAVRLIAHVGDAFDLLVLNQVGNALDGLGLIHLVGNVGDYDLLLFLGGALDGGFGPHGE